MATFTNRATLSYNGRTADSIIVTVTLNETLSATKVALEESYAEGTRLTYVVSLVNSGAVSFTGLTVTDDLGAYEFTDPTGVTATLYPLDYVNGSAKYFVNGVLQPELTVTSTTPLVVSGINVPAGGNAILIYQADVNEFAPLDVDGSITNTVEVNGGTLTDGVTASETVETLDEPNLSITKGVASSVVTEDGAITYTFNIQNTGNTAAIESDNVIVTDTFDPIITINSVILDGTPLTLGTDYTYDAQTGEFATVAGVITVPAATYTRQEDGSFVITPGDTMLVINGTL